MPRLQHTDDIPEAAIRQLDAQSDTPPNVFGCYLRGES